MAELVRGSRLGANVFLYGLPPGSFGQRSVPAMRSLGQLGVMRIRSSIASTARILHHKIRRRRWHGNDAARGQFNGLKAGPCEPSRSGRRKE